MAKSSLKYGAFGSRGEFAAYNLLMASIDLRHVYSLTDFVRNSKAHLDRIKATKAPEVLTVNGRAEVVVQDAESYQDMVDRLEKAELLESLRQGIKGGEAR